jgi:hypothetical protein
MFAHNFTQAATNPISYDGRSDRARGNKPGAKSNSVMSAKYAQDQQPSPARLAVLFHLLEF